MEIIKTNIEGVVIIEPRIFKDDRGYFFESFSQREFEEKVCKTTFVQDNESKSSYGVLRGLHFQKPPFAQSKLVRVIKGGDVFLTSKESGCDQYQVSRDHFFSALYGNHHHTTGFRILLAF